MTAPGPKPRIAVVSPFLDKSHGTERMVVEWISRLSADFEFHIYSQWVQDIDLSRIAWHRIPKIPGPHLINYIWWFAANHVRRFWDRRARELTFDLVFSPGINCLDAHVVSVHIVFSELLHRMASELRLRKNPPRSWLVLVHRRLYYRLIVALERRVFTNPQTQLVLTSPRTSTEIGRFYGRIGSFPIIYAGIDHLTFNPRRCAELRTAARHDLGLDEDDFCLLLIGNDWRKKGLGVLIDALARLPKLNLRLLVVSNEIAVIEREAFRTRASDPRVLFLSPRPDVEIFYSAADLYTGPSLEDTFALPASEAMACGLPVIMSSRTGVSAFISSGVDGLILEDATDAVTLAAMIRRLYEDPELRERMGAKAAETARQFSWEQNARDIAAVFQQVIRRKSQPDVQTLAQES